jgi:hypothetical protein
LQPGLYDTSCRYSSDNIIGQLAQYEKISFTGNNLIDAAIALVNTDEETVGNSTPANGYGTPDSEIATAFVGQTVQELLSSQIKFVFIIKQPLLKPETQAHSWLHKTIIIRLVCSLPATQLEDTLMLIG